MKAVFLNPHENKVQIVEMPNKTQELKDLIGCGRLESVRAQVGKCKCVVICDKEYFYKPAENIRLSFAYPAGGAQGWEEIGGNLLICKEFDSDFIGLENHEINQILEKIKIVWYRFMGETRENLMMGGVVL